MFTRRTLIKSAAGAALLAPFVREALAAPSGPMRLVIVLECNGIYPIAFVSDAVFASLGAAIGGALACTINGIPIMWI